MTTLDNLMMATNTIPTQHSIQGMLSSMTDEDSFIPTTNSSSKQRKADATKILALRMLQGYKPTNHKCTDCNIPLMQSSNSGIVQCVVCVEQLQNSTPAGSMSDDDDESEIQGSMLDDDRDNNNHHHRTKKQNKKSVVSITQEGDIELRQLGTHESLEAKLDITWCTKDGLQNEIVVGESKSSDRSYNSDVDSTTSSVEQLDDSNDTRDSNVVPTLPAFNSINYPHLVKEMEIRRNSALEQQQKQQTKKTKGIKGIKLLEAIDEMSAASSAKKKQQQQLLLQQQLERHEQLQQEESDGKESSSQAEDSSSPKETASSTNSTTPTKFDSTQIIQDTNNILNDLVSTEGSGDGGTSVADASSISPSIMSDGYGYSKKSMKKLTYQNAKKDIESSTPLYSSSPLTGSQRKRMTINNISSEPQQREDRRKVGSLGVDTHDVSQTLYTKPEASPASSPKASQQIEKDDFFSEIRRKALLSKVSTTKNKLNSDLGIIQEDGVGAEDTSVKQQPNWDNVSALESPSSFILPKLNGGIKRPVFGTAKVEEEVVNTVPQSLVKSTKLVGLETSDELHQRLKAANIRQHKQQQLHDEMSPAATIARKKTLWTQPVVPDDEKRELALQSIRKEGVILPFDESTKLSQKILNNMSNTTPKMNNLKTSTEVVTVDEEVGSKNITQAPSESSSFASLSSSVQLQTKRIAQLEADAQRKHQEAELAATTAREALAGMLKKRNVRHDKEMKGGEETADYSVASASQYSYRYPTADSLIAKNTAGSKTKIDLQQDKANDKAGDDLSMSSTLSSLDNKTDDKEKPKKKGGSIDSEESSDSNDGVSTIDTNTTTSTYLDKLQRSLDKRIRRHSLRTSKREFSTPSPSHHQTSRRPPSLRAESSDSSTCSSYTFSTYDSMPERRRSRSIERRSYDRRRHRSLSTPRSRRNGDSGRRKVVPSIMLPSLSSSASPSSRGEQHLPHLSPHEQYHPAAPPRPHTTPNQQTYYPGIGFETGYHPPIDPSFGSIRPSLLSQRVTSDPVLYQQQPLMAHQPRELHYSADGGQFGMPLRRQQYSPSLSSRMATLKLAGLPRNHPYGKKSNTFSQGFSGSYPSGVYPMVPQQKVRFNTAPLPVYESRNDFPTSRR